MTGRLARIILSLLLCASALPVLIQGQQAAGELRGRVTDELGGLVVGADVTLTDALGASRKDRTDGAGGFRFSGLAPGRYSVRVEASGFAPFEDADVEIKLKDNETLAVRLGVALEKQEVTVGTETGLSTGAANNAAR